MKLEERPDVGWVAALTGASERRAAAALAEAAAERRLFGAIDRAHRAEGRSSYVEIDAPLELYAIVRILRPSHIVEVGVSSGVSSAYLLAALDRNRRGTLHSVDLPKLVPLGRRGSRAPTSSWSLPPGRSSGWAVPFGLRARWDLRLGNKRIVIPLLADELPEIGLVVYDVPHNEAELAREFRLLDSKLVPDGTAISDHGPGGGCCVPLARWATARGGTAVRCQDFGLFGFHARPSAPRARRASTRKGPRRGGRVVRRSRSRTRR